MTYRIEIYRPHPDNGESFTRARFDSGRTDAGLLLHELRRARPGTFALVIHIDGDEETVLERWRVSADGRISRAVYDVRERELEQP